MEIEIMEQMKNATILSFMTMISFSTYGQRKEEPTYYLDSKEINFKRVYIKATSLDSIYVNKQTVNGEIYLFTKNEEISFFSLKDILKKYTDLTSLNDSILIRINGDVINDISGIKIDKSYFIYVEVSDVSDTNYLSDIFKSLKIVSIDLEQDERKPEIWLRGNDI